MYIKLRFSFGFFLGRKHKEREALEDIYWYLDKDGKGPINAWPEKRIHAICKEALGL